MKTEQILKVMETVLDVTGIDALNKALKEKASLTIKFKIMGEKFGYLGLTVAIKAITPEGIKIFDVNKVRLIRFSDIESFEKAKPKVKRPDRPKKAKVLPQKPQKTFTPKKKAEVDAEDDDDELDDDDLVPQKRSYKGSSYIPPKKSR